MRTRKNETAEKSESLVTFGLNEDNEHEFSYDRDCMQLI